MPSTSDFSYQTTRLQNYIIMMSNSIIGNQATIKKINDSSIQAVHKLIESLEQEISLKGSSSFAKLKKSWGAFEEAHNSDKNLEDEKQLAITLKENVAEVFQFVFSQPTEANTPQSHSEGEERGANPQLSEQESNIAESDRLTTVANVSKLEKEYEKFIKATFLFLISHKNEEDFKTLSPAVLEQRPFLARLSDEKITASKTIPQGDYFLLQKLFATALLELNDLPADYATCIGLLYQSRINDAIEIAKKIPDTYFFEKQLAMNAIITQLNLPSLDERLKRLPEELHSFVQIQSLSALIDVDPSLQRAKKFALKYPEVEMRPKLQMYLFYLLDNEELYGTCTEIAKELKINRDWEKNISLFESIGRYKLAHILRCEIFANLSKDEEKETIQFILNCFTSLIFRGDKEVCKTLIPLNVMATQQVTILSLLKHFILRYDYGRVKDVLEIYGPKSAKCLYIVLKDVVEGENFDKKMYDVLNDFYVKLEKDNNIHIKLYEKEIEELREKAKSFSAA